MLTEDAMQEATEWSTTATVAWLLDRGCPFVEEALVLRSCSNISGDIFQFLVETKHMQYDPHVCKYEAMKHGWFSDTVLRDLAGSPCRQVRSGDIGRVRYALEQKARVSWSPLRAMIEDEDHAMLYDTLDQCLVRRKVD